MSKHKEMTQLYEDEDFDDNNLPSAPPRYSMDPSTTAGPSAGYYPQNPTQQVIIVPAPAFGRNPVRSTCPTCGKSQKSRVLYENNMKTHIAAFLCFITICCCCIPYMMDSCKSVNHYCTRCNAFLGTYAN